MSSPDANFTQSTWPLWPDKDIKHFSLPKAHKFTLRSCPPVTSTRPVSPKSSDVTFCEWAWISSVNEKMAYWKREKKTIHSRLLLMVNRLSIDKSNFGTHWLIWRLETDGIIAFFLLLFHTKIELYTYGPMTNDCVCVCVCLLVSRPHNGCIFIVSESQTCSTRSHTLTIVT